MIVRIDADRFRYELDILKGESARGAVLIGGQLLDNALGDLLGAYMQGTKKEKDGLLNRALRNFGVRIELAYS